MGRWTPTPWVAILDPTITTSPQNGYYPVYLFREDMSGLYLSLNQGVTDIQERYGSGNEARRVLRRTAEMYREFLPNNIADFNYNDIDLVLTNRTVTPSYYQDGNICSVFYEANNFPGEQTILDHLRAIIRYYALLITTQAEPPPATGIADPQEQYRNITLSRRIRDSALIRRLKTLHNNQCQICGLALQLNNGVLYSEGHHIKPLGGNHNGPDTEENVIILCPNHHALCDYRAIRLEYHQIRTHRLHRINEEYIAYHNDLLLGTNGDV
jgi:5-methylcytosine-specific restriction enzyme A